MGFVKTDTIGITIMSEKIIKWGFIGCGEVTKTKSGPAFQKVEHSEVVAVMSRDGAKAKAYAKERGIKKWYDDAQELIDDPEVNAIYIATPPSSHATYAIGTDIRRVYPYQPYFARNRHSLFRCLLPTLSPVLTKSKRACRKRFYR